MQRGQTMSIKSRLEVLEQRAQRKQDTPPNDPLSRSLYEFGDELSRLDEFEKSIQAEEMGIALTDIDDMIRHFKKTYLKRRF